MASLLSALALCIIFMIIIELSNSETGIHGKRTRNKKRKTVAPPVRMKHTKSEKRVRQLFTKRTQHKTGIKHVSSNRAVLRPKWNKKHTKKGIWTKKVQSNKIKPKSQRSSMFVNKIKNQKGKGFVNKSVPKGKNSQRFLSNGKKRFSNTGIKRTGRRRGVKVGRKGKKFLGPKIIKFDNMILMNEVLVPGKDGVPAYSPNSPIHKVEPVKQKTPITSISEKTLVSYQDMTEITESSKKKDASDTKIIKFDTQKLMNEVLVPEKVDERVEPKLIFMTHSPIDKEEPETQKIPVTSRPEVNLLTTMDTLTTMETQKIIQTAEPSFSQKVTTQKTLMLQSNEISKNKVMKNGQLVRKQTTVEEALREAREEQLERIYNEPSKSHFMTTPKTQIRVVKTEGMSPEQFRQHYLGMYCAHYVNNRCYNKATPSVCYERDWTGRCTHFYKHLDELFKDVTIPPMSPIVTFAPDFHLRYKESDSRFEMAGETD